MHHTRRHTHGTLQVAKLRDEVQLLGDKAMSLAAQLADERQQGREEAEERVWQVRRRVGHTGAEAYRRVYAKQMERYSECQPEGLPGLPLSWTF